MKKNLNLLPTNFTPPASKVALACSGGGDSVALYHFLRAHIDPKNIHVLHFNHNLRPTAQTDATFTQNLATTHSSPYHTHTWQETPQKNLQQAARNARYTFFQNICTQENITHLYLGHTQNDRIENLFMRLNKGSGLTGLTSLKNISQRQNLTLHRPFLNTSRQTLRTFLTTNHYTWQEDPSNNNPAYARIHIRQNLPKLNLDDTAIASSIASLSRAEETLQTITTNLFNTHWHNQTFPADILLTQPEDLQIRLLGSIIQAYFPHDMLPRTSKRQAALKKLANKQKTTLGGLIFTPKNKAILTEKEHPHKSLTTAHAKA